MRQSDRNFKNAPRVTAILRDVAAEIVLPRYRRLAAGDVREKRPGDLYAIPPDLPHSIQLFSKTARLVDCFTPLREDFLGKQ